MAICAAESFTDFVSDCADIACADRFLMRHFLSIIAPDTGKADEPRPLFSQVFVTGDTTSSLTCGAVDLTPWISSASTLARESALFTNGFGFHGSVSYPVVSASPVSASRTAPKHQWRLTTLLVLIGACVVMLCVDASMLCWLLPKRRRLLQKASEREQSVENHEPA
ncbi:hypothetical protein Q4I30_007493 [Leishmania utingensis]|uniref:Transmembrane protein n=1 Tax=Leishmania utingensis TaxID=653362 RepID=A0AAW2ZWB1_9TRYP